MFTNHWLWIAIAVSFGLQIVVVYVPVLQRAFGTVDLSMSDWVRCAVAATAVLWVSELLKLWNRHVIHRA